MRTYIKYANATKPMINNVVYTNILAFNDFYNIVIF